MNLLQYTPALYILVRSAREGKVGDGLFLLRCVLGKRFIYIYIVQKISNFVPLVAAFDAAIESELYRHCFTSCAVDKDAATRVLQQGPLKKQ